MTDYKDFLKLKTGGLSSKLIASVEARFVVRKNWNASVSISDL